MRPFTGACNSVLPARFVPAHAVLRLVLECRRTVQPLLTPCLRGGKATCFAYGQTGSGKTYTMQVMQSPAVASLGSFCADCTWADAICCMWQPLPVRTAVELLQLLRLPQYQETRLFVSCFEIYGGMQPLCQPCIRKLQPGSRCRKPTNEHMPRDGTGKLYDLLNGRKHLIAREGRNKEICIVDLREYLVDCSELVDGLLQHAADSRTTGSTGGLPTAHAGRC